MLKIIYVAGYGRSGSTMLGVVLGSQAQVVDVGELAFLAQEWRAVDRVCACGKKYEECSFWGDLPPSLVSEQAIKVARAHEGGAALAHLLSTEVDASYRDLQMAILEYVSGRAGASHIIDSSKSARHTTARFLALQRLTDVEVYVLHLVRDGLAVMESRLVVGSNLALQGYEHRPRLVSLRTAISWVLANLSVHILARWMPVGRYLRVRYEDFMDAPSDILRAIGAWVGLDMTDVISHVEQQDSFPIGHLVGGNRIRQETALRLRKSTRRSGERLTRGQRLLFQLTAGWLNHYYGYGKVTNG